MLGLVKVKFAAVLLGPSGVGLIGLLQSLVASASTLAGMGVTNAGTREVAQALRDRERLCRLRAALFYGTAGLASVAAIVVWACREAIAEQVLGNVTHAAHVGWVALAVALTIGSGSQKALIRGMQRSRDIAMVLIWGAAIGMVVGVVGLLALGDHGIFLFIVATPLGSFLAGFWYAKQLPKGEKARGVRAIVSEWHRLLRLGAVLMMAGCGVVLGHLWLRTQIAQVLGVQQLGYFQAAWMVSATYIGFVLTAMGNEYFPRIAASLGMPNRIVDMANQQTEVVFLVGVPILLTAYLFPPC